jgi:cholesterol oxidase
MSSSQGFDCDFVVVGSGFGGSVSALRLAQKGYKVLVVEAGKRWKTEEFPKTSWSLPKFLWAPKLFCYGIQRITLLRDVLVLSGAGVGGGSLVYANTLYVPPAPFFAHRTVQEMGGAEAILPFFDVARRMLGVVENPRLWPADELMAKTATEMGFGDTFVRTPVGVFFGPGEAPLPDPYFDGEGPDRTPCSFCGGCMVGCRFGAKNTLDKNYLYLAEKLGAEVLPETQVVDLAPLSPDGSAGWELRTRSTTGWFGHPRRTLRAAQVVLSAGVLGTLDLLTRMQEAGRLPKLSARLGHTVRTNSESLIGVSTFSDAIDHSRGIAITSSVHPDEHTHIEPVRYSAGSDAMATLAAPVLVDGGGRVPRQVRFVASVLRHPLRSLRMAWPVGFAKKSIILLVMQTVDNSIRLVRKRRWFWPVSRSLTSVQDQGERIPTYIPVANEFARKLAKNMGGTARSSVNEALLDVPATAHILGGACIGETEASGVVDLENRAFGYPTLRICDGSMIPANLGVNPSLTITALSERAMSFVPPKDPGEGARHFAFEVRWGVLPTLDTPKP